jgi:Molybdopterin-binding domain of aldehyde dehydrogenase
MTRDQAFLFDLDDTLVDSVYQHVLASQEVLDQVGGKARLADAMTETPRGAQTVMVSPREFTITLLVNGTPYRVNVADSLQLLQEGVRAPAELIDINGLALAGIEVGPNGARIGALARMAEVADDRRIDPPRMTYSCPNVRTRFRLVDMHTNTPCPMWAPGTATGVLALEMAMDELAVALGMDPAELRLKNYADRDEHKNPPWSSKELRASYRMAAERFGWATRSPQPRSMRHGHVLIGYGMAAAVYPAERSAASASATIFADRTALVRSAASDIVGTYDVGRVVSPKLARSQCLGGMVGGLGMALLEQAECDSRYGRVMNSNLAEYLLPVNADVTELEALFVPSSDPRVNPLGVKGLAEIALCGVAPAIANAVYHATGKRVREIRPEVAYAWQLLATDPISLSTRLPSREFRADRARTFALLPCRSPDTRWAPRPD